MQDVHFNDDGPPQDFDDVITRIKYEISTAGIHARPFEALIGDSSCFSSDRMYKELRRTYEALYALVLKKAALEIAFKTGELMITELNLSLLKEVPELKKKLRLEILPLAPLSMTSGVAGSYYKSDLEPGKKMVCGLLENYLGWQLSAQDRKSILADINKARKKIKSQPITDSFEGSNYQPLIWDFFEIENIEKPKMESYDDYWSRAFQRKDAINHPKGTFQASHEAVIAKRSLPRDEKGIYVTKDYEDYFKLNYGLWPMYYSTPTKREFIYADMAHPQPYVLYLEMDLNLAELLLKAEGEPCYLGTSEGWVDLKISAL